MSKKKNSSQKDLFKSASMANVSAPTAKINLEKSKTPGSGSRSRNSSNSKQKKTKIVDDVQESKTSEKKNGIVEAFAANTHNGVSDKDNLDRVSIVTNLMPPKERKNEFYTKKGGDESLRSRRPWPRCSYYGIYQGSIGPECAEYLRDNLQKLITIEPTFPDDPVTAIREAIRKADDDFFTSVAYD